MNGFDWFVAGAQVGFAAVGFAAVILAIPAVVWLVLLGVAWLMDRNLS